MSATKSQSNKSNDGPAELNGDTPIKQPGIRQTAWDAADFLPCLIFMCLSLLCVSGCPPLVGDSYDSVASPPPPPHTQNNDNKMRRLLSHDAPHQLLVKPLSSLRILLLDANGDA